MERLDKILAGTGRWSRREVRDLVKAGRVSANGARAASADEKYERLGLDLRVDGEQVGSGAFYYLMLHKPAGLLSATEDPKQPTVLDLLPEHLRRVGLFPVGRLDKDTEGLLLLTNDGPLGHELLSPKKHVDKVYFVRVDGILNEEDAAMFRQGVVLGDGLHCLPAELELLPEPNTGLVTLREGKYHQVKRMLASREKPVLHLKRLSMGPLTLDPALQKGEWRELTEKEKAGLTDSRGR
ncbi:MAG: 16S rRNA pseudouridine(516) synthase [Clostridia bacterium]|nr:16S rRNA pseudouridine(516) synthase [Clostridia bacterium]